jgi:hypothetical protein
MSISKISSNSDYYQNYSLNGSDSLKQKSQQDIKSLANALQSNDLSGAQNAFASLLQLLSTASSSANSQKQSTTVSASGSSNGTSSITNDLSTLGQAIQSGNLTSAQNDFSKLMQDMQAIGGGHHHHHHHKMSASTQDTTTAAATGASTGTNSLANDLATLGQALQSGDLKSAGNAYSQLTQDMQSTNSTANSNAGFQQLLNLWTQSISSGSSINIST